MRECWLWNPQERPTFTEIVNHLDRILCSCSNDEYLDVGFPKIEALTPTYCNDESNTQNMQTFQTFPNLLWTFS